MNLVTRTFNFNDIGFDKEIIYKVLKLSMQEDNAHYEEIIDLEIDAAKSLCEIKGGYRILENISHEKESIGINDIQFNVGKMMAAYLKKAQKVALFVCTAGKGIEVRSRQLMKDGFLLEGYILDTIGSVVVETAMDMIQKELLISLKPEGYKISNRYSPGYCDWMVNEQSKLFSFFPENFCGISLSESCLMSPVKSVSGIIGIGEKIPYNQYACDHCTNTECVYRNIK